MLEVMEVLEDVDELVVVALRRERVVGGLVMRPDRMVGGLEKWCDEGMVWVWTGAMILFVVVCDSQRLNS